jgi:hypothetical protein
VRLANHIRQELHDDRAPAALRERCAKLAAEAGRAPSRPQVDSALPRASSWRARVAPMALAAALVMVVAGAVLYRATDASARVLVAELAADHVKCFGLNALLGTHHEPAAVESSMLSRFGWHVRLPHSDTEGTNLELVGARPCLYGEGQMAHVMYRHEGRAVSLFILPKRVRPDEAIQVLGHEAVIWSSGGRTFVLIAREPRGDVERLASTIQMTLR